VPDSAPRFPRLTGSGALKQLPAAPAEPYVILFRYGTLTIGLYAPRGTDPQGPHLRDEVYVILQGSGTFVNGETRHPFAAGDTLFVPAHQTHRFEDFTDDFATWVMFYGPDGGEPPGPSTVR
jgi:mannose-6-phosphate isomerase-like protein (cupin superfamily)